MSVLELYRNAKLDEAIQAALADVKKKPTDLNARFILCELLSFAGDIERADKQLDVVTSDEQPKLNNQEAMKDPSAMAAMQANMAVMQFRHVLRAELARQQFFNEGRIPEVLLDPTEEMELRLEASVLIREGKIEEAAPKLEAAEEKRLPVPGKCNDVPFDDFRDVDDLTSSFFEVLTNNDKYYWVPFHQVISIEFHQVKRVRDLYWRQAQIQVENGPTGQVYIPALYPGSHKSEDDEVRLGKKTEFLGEETPVRGMGQRLYYFVAGEEEPTAMPISEFNHIEFDLEKVPERPSATAKTTKSLDESGEGGMTLNLSAGAVGRAADPSGSSEADPSNDSQPEDKTE